MSRVDRTTDRPDVVRLRTLAEQLLAEAATRGAQRAAHTLPHPVDGLRQTVIALIAGQQLAEHESPGPASLLVLRDSVRLVAGDDEVGLGEHQVAPIPHRRHSLHADEDFVVMLSVAVPQRAPAAR